MLICVELYLLKEQQQQPHIVNVIKKKKKKRLQSENHFKKKVININHSLITQRATKHTPIHTHTKYHRKKKSHLHTINF